MSLKSMLQNSKFLNKKSTRIGAGVAGALLIATAIAPASGAYFAASDTGTASHSTATLSVTLDDDTLAFSNMAPGVEQTDGITATNHGTIPANVTLKFSDFTGTGNPSNPEQLRYYVEGYTSWTPVFNNGAGSAVNIGVIQPGQSVRYTVHERLDAEADDTWQGVTGSSKITVTLNQQH